MGLSRKLTAKSTIFLFSSLFLIAALVTSGFFYFKADSKNPKKVVATVGAIQITEDQVQYQMAVNKIMIRAPSDRAFALKQLTENVSYQQIMEKYNWPIQVPDLIRESERIQKNSRSPRIIREVRRIQGFDPSYYLIIFVRGVLVQRLIFNEFYFSRNEIHQPTRKKATQFAEQMKGQTLIQIRTQAIEQGLDSFDLEINPVKGMTLQQIQLQSSPGGPAAIKKEPVTLEEKKSRAAEWIQLHKQYENAHDAFLFNEGEVWSLLFPAFWEPRREKVKGLLVRFPKEPFQSWVQKELRWLQAGPESAAVGAGL